MNLKENSINIKTNSLQSFIVTLFNSKFNHLMLQTQIDFFNTYQCLWANTSWNVKSYIPEVSIIDADK